MPRDKRDKRLRKRVRELERQLAAAARARAPGHEPLVREADASAHMARLQAREETCRRNAAELEVIYKSAPIGLAVLDRDLRYLRINDHMAALNGIPAAAHTGKTVLELFPHLSHFVTRITRTILQTGEPVLDFELTGTMPSPQGTQRHWSESWLPLKSPEGHIWGFNVVVMEITERKRAESGQELLIEIALRLLQPLEKQELFDFVTASIYSMTGGGIVLFSEFDPARNVTILRTLAATPEERTIVRQQIGRDPGGITFHFPDNVRTEVLPGELKRLSGGICELTFHQLPVALCESIEQALNVRSVYAMACSVERDLLGTVAILTGAEELPNKRLIETVVTETALALKRRRAEEALQNERNFFDTVVDTQGALLAILDPEQRIVRLNRAYYAIAGFPPGSMSGRRFNELMEPGTAIEELPALDVEQHPPNAEFETRLRVRGDGIRYVSWRTTVKRNEHGNIEYIIAAGIDISDRKNMEERTRYLAEHDALTNLPNRRLLLELLNAAMESARRSQRRVAVLFVDLDRFKSINDTLGHEAGDVLLTDVARRLSARVRRSDIVSRLGGDEFAVLLSDLSRSEQAGEVAKEILHTFHQPFHLGVQTLHTSASVGISLFPDDDDSADGLLRRADLAMYEAKEQGRNTFRFYNPVVDTRAHDRARIEHSLRLALERGELQLLYQPEVDLRTGNLVGVEALVRWNHPELGLLEPERFIPVAEETELIALIDDWVLASACRQARLWLDEGARPVHVAVNLSARRFDSPDLPDMVRRRLDENTLPPQCLELELTEYTVMHRIEQSIMRMRELVNLGVSIAIDDFGTGYSSLSYLKQLPIRTLKIDQSFVRDIPIDADDRAIIQAVTALAHTLRKRVIAEGVEMETQRSFLMETGCDEGQGYLFNRPLAAQQVTPLFFH